MRTPLTKAEHARLRILISDGWTHNIPADDRLISLGLVRRSQSDCSVEPVWEVVGACGVESYYEMDGSVNLVSYPVIGQPDVLDPANCPPRRSKR